MKLHYFIVENTDGTFQAQESQESYGGEHDHPAEIEGGKVTVYATQAEASAAVLRVRNEAQCSPLSTSWRITMDRKTVRKAWRPRRV
jgi:hypothetical protein